MAVSSSGYSLQVGVRVDTNSLKSQLDTFGGKYVLNIQANVTGIEQTSKLSTNIQNMTANVQQMSVSMGTATNATNKFTSQATTDYNKLGRTIQGAIESQKSLGKVLVDQARTRAVTLAINEVIQLTQQAVQTIKEFDDALTEMKKVSDLSGEALDDYTKKLGELGETVARTRTEMVESATQFIKSGYSEEDSAKLAQTAELFRNIADSEISSAESANFIISQMKAFGDETDEFATHAINSINEVSNNMAVSSTDISTALSKTSSAMGTLGNTYEETIGLVTAGAEIMQGQSSKVARGLRTVGNNIANVAQQQKTLAVETQNGTKQIELFDKATGDMRSTYDILGDIAQQWDNMTNAQKQAIGIALAGKNQFEVFASVEENFADAQKAVEYATDSENSALNENARFMESISAKTNLVQSQLQELVLGNGGLTDFVKLLLDATNALLKFANSGVGKAIINVTLFYTALVLLSKGAGIAKIVIGDFAVNVLKSFIWGIGKATTATEGLIGVLKMLEIDPIILGISTAIVVIAGLVTAYKKLQTSISDADEKLKESISSYDEAKEKVEDLEKQIKELESERKGLTDEEDLRNLDIEKAKLEAELQIQKDITAEKEKQALKDAEKTANKVGFSTGYTEFGQHGQASASKTAIFGTASQNLTSQISDIEKLDGEISKLIEKKNALAKTDAEYEQLSEHHKKQYDELASKIDNYNNVLTEVKGSAVTNVQALKDVIYAGGDAEGTYQELIDKYIETSKESDTLTDSLENQGSESQMTEDDIEDLAEGLDELNDQLEEAQKQYDASLKSVSSMDKEFGALNDAIAEYNSTGALSLDTISDLLALDSDYLSLLNFENGQMSLNKDGALALANAKIDLAESDAIIKAQAELSAISMGQYNDTLSASKQASDICVWSAQQAGQAILASGDDALESAQKWATAWKAITNGMNFTTDEQKRQAKVIEDSLKSEITSYESLRGNIGKVTSATNANTKSKSSNTKATNENTKALKENLEALKEQKEALEDQKNTYDKVISYIEKKLEDAIDKIEDKRDEELDALEELYDKEVDRVNDYIDALEDEKNAIVDKTNAEIDALEKARDTEQDYWQEKIDALKDANDALNDQIELEKLLGELERAKATNKMIYREGQGFVYEADSEAVNTAQANLQTYYRNKQYEDALDELEYYKEESKKKYDEQIDDLNEYINKVENDFDKNKENLESYLKELKEQYDNQVDYIKNYYQFQIDFYQDYLNKFKEDTDRYENEQLRKQALQLTGIDFEKKGWETQLDNLKDFVKKYDELQKKVTDITNKVTEAQKAYNEATKESSSSSSGSSDSGGVSTSGGGSTTTKGGKSSDTKYQGMIGKYYSWKKGVSYANLTKGTTGKTKTQGTHTMLVQEITKEGNGTYYAVGKNKDGCQIKMKVSDLQEALKQALYSGGSYGIKEDGIAIVGDDPQFSELVIGSKLNSGAKLLNATKGTGVIPHNLTSTLVSMAQAFQGQTQLQTTNNSTATTISIGNISLPNVSNGEQFVDYLQNFNLDMTTLAYTR